jgi:hypothetical protein
MAEILNVVITAARCARGRQTFGIRMEERALQHWIADWAFGLSDGVAEREGYGRTTITGTFSFEGAYPGCPHCQARSMFQCSCGKVSCWNGEQRMVACAWCGAAIRLDREISAMTVAGDP